MTSPASSLVIVLALWHMRVQHVSPSKVALGYGTALGALSLVDGASVSAAVLRGVLAGVALWLVVWVDQTFHSWASLPLWFVAIVVLGWFL
jgi:hypothetical protein